MTVHDFIETLGGPTKVARGIGLPITTVNTWQRRNSIPGWRMPAVAAFAHDEGHSVPGSFDKPEDVAA